MVDIRDGVRTAELRFNVSTIASDSINRVLKCERRYKACSSLDLDRGQNFCQKQRTQIQSLKSIRAIPLKNVGRGWGTGKKIAGGGGGSATPTLTCRILA